MHHRFRTSTVTALTTLAMLAGLSTVANAASSLQPVRSVKTQVVLGGIEVSWAGSKSGVTYTVATPTTTGPSCTVIGGSSCVVPISSLGSWAFTVTSRSGQQIAISTKTRAISSHLVVVSAGQSNSLGGTSYVVDPATKVNYMAAPYTNGADANDLIIWAQWNLAAPVDKKKHVIKTPVPLDTPQLPISGKTGPAIFGPELGFARQVWDDTQTPLTIVKASFGGTSMYEAWNASNGPLFSGMVKLVKNTMTADAQKGQLDVLGAFVWYQGESDTAYPAWAAAYQSSLATFITTLRSTLPSATNLPFVLIKESSAAYIAATCAATCPSYSASDAVVRAADDWAASNIAGVVAIDSIAASRTAESKFVHLSNVGELLVGTTAAIAVEPLVAGLAVKH